MNINVKLIIVDIIMNIQKEKDLLYINKMSHFTGKGYLFNVNFLLNAAAYYSVFRCYLRSKIFFVVRFFFVIRNVLFILPFHAAKRRVQTIKCEGTYFSTFGSNSELYVLSGETS